MEGAIVALPVIHVPGKEVAKGMAHFPGGQFTMGTDDLKIKGSRETLVPPHQRNVDPFYLDTTEVTVAAYLKVMKGDGPRFRGIQKLAPSDAICNVSFDRAVFFAEKVGKRLPDEAEYEFAATNGGKQQYPWGNEAPPGPWTFGPVGSPEWDRTTTKPPVFGLYSGVAEWTTSWIYPYPTSSPENYQLFFDPRFNATFRASRVVRGGPPSVVEGQPDPQQISLGARFRSAYLRDALKPGLGFRCCRSAAPRFLEGP
jgi:formylglycine-generating enzyme required for sulfatase activity